MTKKSWLEIEPVDTMFSPMPATITGAIRTAILRQKDITPAAYQGAGQIPAEEPAAWHTARTHHVLRRP